jgi:DNA polymerase-3 subunit alpha
MKIVIDTESTGLTRLSFANKLNYKQWPRMVQIAWALIDEGAIVERRSFLIQPDDHTIPASSTQIHGIDQKNALENGVPIEIALPALQDAFSKCDCVIAHNLSFDLGMIESEALRIDLPIRIPPKRICTVHLGRQYLQRIKGIKRGGYPKLSQLYESLLGFNYSGQHHADHDVTACFHVYKKLSQLGFQ